MKPALAQVTDHNALEDLGRATLQIVHDLKNQLNGLKLYATFLRKRLERDERATEERETLVKLIAGLDRAAKDMTVLVRYSQPVELQRQSGIDLRNLVSSVSDEVQTRLGANVQLAFEIDGPLYGEFDRAALSETLNVLTDEAISSVPLRDIGDVSLCVRRDRQAGSSQAALEWRGVKLAGRNHSFRSSESFGTVHTAQAARVIEAHGGRFECDESTIRVWLPLSE